MPSNWFAQNAPAAPGGSGSDWFAQHAPGAPPRPAETAGEPHDAGVLDYLKHALSKTAHNLDVTPVLQQISTADSLAGQGRWGEAWNEIRGLLPGAAASQQVLGNQQGTTLQEQRDFVHDTYDKARTGDYSGATANVATAALANAEHAPAAVAATRDTLAAARAQGQAAADVAQTYGARVRANAPAVGTALVNAAKAVGPDLARGAAATVIPLVGKPLSAAHLVRAGQTLVNEGVFSDLKSAVSSLLSKPTADEVRAASEARVPLWKKEAAPPDVVAEVADDPALAQAAAQAPTPAAAPVELPSGRKPGSIANQQEATPAKGSSPQASHAAGAPAPPPPAPSPETPAAPQLPPAVKEKLTTAAQDGSLAALPEAAKAALTNAINAGNTSLVDKIITLQREPTAGEIAHMTATENKVRVLTDYAQHQGIDIAPFQQASARIQQFMQEAELPANARGSKIRKQAVAAGRDDIVAALDHEQDFADAAFAHGVAKQMPVGKNGYQGVSGDTWRLVESALAEQPAHGGETPAPVSSGPAPGAGNGQPAAALPTSNYARTEAPDAAAAGSGRNPDPGNARESGSLPRASEPVSGPGRGQGADTVVKVPGKGIAYPAVYQVRELSDIQPSHNGENFTANPRYAYQNERNYGNAANQGKVVNWSLKSQFDPAFHITDNPDALNGPLVTDADGNVLGGNGRAMILQRVHSGNAAGAAAYRDLLIQKAAQFGLDPKDIAQMRQPVLVREIPPSAFRPGATAADAINDFNVKGTAELTPAERALADARRVSTATLDDMAARLERFGPDASLAQMLEGKGGREVFERLVDDGVIASQERAAFTDADGKLTKAGRDRIANLMVGRFFRDPSQLDAIPASIRNKVERIAAPLAQAEAAGGDWSITTHMQDAIELLEKARTHGVKNLDDYIQQSGLFGAQEHAAEAVALAKALQNLTPKQLTAAVQQFAAYAAHASKGESLFGAPPTAAEAFDAAFREKQGAPGARLLRPFREVPFHSEESLDPQDAIRDAQAFYRPGKGGKPGTLYVNAQARDVLYGLAGIHPDPEWQGLWTPRAEAKQALSRLNRALLTAPVKYGVSAAQTIFQLRQELARAVRQEGRGVLFADAGAGQTISDVKATLRHEWHHADEVDFTAEAAQKLLKEPLAERAARALVENGYEDDPVLLASEIGAHLKEGPSGHEVLMLNPKQALALWDVYRKRYPGAIDEARIHPTLRTGESSR